MQITGSCLNLSINVRNHLLISIKRHFTRDAKKLNSQETATMKVLHVAEKNDAAKHISAHLSRGTSRRVSNIQM